MDIESAKVVLEHINVHVLVMGSLKYKLGHYVVQTFFIFSL